MNRDLAVPVLLAVLALGALPSSGLFASGDRGVDAPGTYLTFALLSTAAFAFLLVPWLRNRGRGGALRIGVLALAALPFLVYGLRAAPAPPAAVLVPGWAFLLALTAGMVLAALPRRLASAIGATVLVFLGADALLGASGFPLLPARWVAGAGPVAILGGLPPEGTEPADGPRPGLRAGAPVAVETTFLGEGPGPWFEAATVGRIAGERPFVLLLDGRSDGEVVRAGGAGTFVPRGTAVVEPSLAVDAFDASLVLSGAWPEDAPEAPRLADAVALRTSRGGLLLGPAPGRAGPRPLGRLLGAAGAAERSGAEGVRPFGLGRVVRASSEAEARAVLAAGLWRPRVRTAFDVDGAGGGGAPPRVPPALAAQVRPEVPARGAQGVLLLVYAVVAGLMDRILRGAGPRLLGVLGPALAVTVGLLWTAPAAPRVGVAGLRLELGGGGGRRIEAVLLEAGPGGWAGYVRFQGGGAVRMLAGGRTGDGRVHVPPGRRAWVVRESVATGDGSALGRRVEAPFVRAFVRGTWPGEAVTGRIDALPVRIEGLGRIGAWTLGLR